MGDQRVMAFDLGAEDYAVRTKSTIRDGKWVAVQMIRIRDGNGWREIPVPSAEEIYNRIMADGPSEAKLDAAIEQLRIAK